MSTTTRVPWGRTALAVQALVAIAFLAFLLQLKGYLPGPGYEYELAVRSPLGLKGDNEHPVTLRGVAVGKITEVRPEGGQAVAEFVLRDPTAAELLRSDASATIAYRSAFANLAVDIDPGRARTPLEEGDRIAERQVSGPVAPDQVVQTLDTDTRAQLAVLLGELRLGTEGTTTPLRRALVELGRASEPAAGVADALADRRRLLSRLVAELDRVYTSLGWRREALTAVVEAGGRTLAATGNRDAELAAAIRRLPPALRALDGALAEVEQLARPLEPALVRLRPAARSLRPALVALRATVPEARALLRDLKPLVPEARGPLARLRRASEALGPASASLTPSARDLRRLLGPVAERRAGFVPLGENLSGALSTNDRNGPLLRSVQFFEPFDPASFGAPGARGERLTRLRSRVVGVLLDRCAQGDAQACLLPALVPGLGAGPVGASEPPRLRLPDDLRKRAGAP